MEIALYGIFVCSSLNLYILVHVETHCQSGWVCIAECLYMNLDFICSNIDARTLEIFVKCLWWSYETWVHCSTLYEFLSWANVLDSSWKHKVFWEGVFITLVLVLVDCKLCFAESRCLVVILNWNAVVRSLTGHRSILHRDSYKFFFSVFSFLSYIYVTWLRFR